MKHHKKQLGFVLLVTMIVLVVLSTLVAGLAVQLTMARRRQSYMIEYQRARYALDSALKYFLAEMPRQSFQYENREGKPDFSDIFIMDQQEYAQFIADWLAQATDEQIQAAMKEGAGLTQPQLSPAEQVSMLASIFGGGLQSDPNAASTTPEGYASEGGYDFVEIDPNDIEVPGPYGVEWPYVMEPIEFEMGSAVVTIDIEDENAKLPLSWFVTTSTKVNKQAEHALDSFCEWMAWTPEDLQILKKAVREGTKEIHNKKAFKLNAGPIIQKKTTSRSASSKSSSSRRTVTSRRSPSRKSSKATKTTTKSRPAVAHRTDFAKLFHSSLLDQGVLARPLPDTGERVESPLKYLGLWGSQRVNINSAPRHVLEATFTMVMDSFTIPDFVGEVIKRRQEKSFTKLDELKDIGYINADELKQLGNYMTTKSTFFKIHVTSRSGNAKASAIATVVKEGKKTETLGILYNN